MNQPKRTTIFIFIAIGWIVLACNFPTRRNTTLTPTAGSSLRLHGLAPQKIFFAGTIGVPTAMAGAKNTLAATPTGAGTHGISSGCPAIFHEDFDGPIFFVMAGSSMDPPTIEWDVDELSAISKTTGLPGACSQGKFCGVTKSTSNYDDNAEDALYTPIIDFTGYPLPIVLTFDLAYDLEPTFDGMRILLSPDFESDWYLATPQGGYPPTKSPYGNYLTSDVAVFNYAPGYSGDSGGWVAASVDLSPMIAISPHWTIAFEFASDYSVNAAGVTIDNIRVIPYCPATATSTLPSTSTSAITSTRIRIIPTTEVPPPPRPTSTPCSPTHGCE
jgi:hypothetical protein